MDKEMAVTVRGITKCFQGKEVIHKSDMSVPYGSIYGFLGENGAGKTTIFKILLGLLKPSCGTAKILGLDSRNDNISVLKRTGSIIDIPIFYEHLSAIDNLKLHLEYMEAEKGSIEETLKMVGLLEVGEQQVHQFSMGMRQRLAIARAIVHNPELLILDEPLNGLDPIGIKEMRELFTALSKEKGMTILLSSHILSEIEQTADYVGFIINGRITEECSLAEIKSGCGDSLENYFIRLAGRMDK